MKENINSDKNFSESFNEVNSSKLLLFNDDINTFQFVIETLVDLCDYDEIQAEQLATIAHYKGKVVIKTGTFAFLQALKEEFSTLGLSVTIE